MIYKFTNSKGAVNYGIITEELESGYYILFDAFDIKPGVQLPVRRSFVAREPNPYVLPNSSRREVLPLSTAVQWQDKQLAAEWQRLNQ